jgi:3-oxoacyl-[acyl-carrier protein] reductase
MSEKIAIVTGASRGIGAAIAKKLAGQGMLVVLNYSGSRERALAVQQEITEQGGKAEIRQWDVSDSEQCEAAVKEIMETYGHVDVLVNNAGITRDGLLMRMSDEDFSRVMNVNLGGAFHMMKQVSRHMLKARKGRIINIASVVGLMGNAGQVNYAASKAGIIGATKSAAKELASRGITVNAVAPGFIATEMTDALNEKVQQQIKTQIPMGTFGQPEDIANCVAFLASEEAAYITGQVLQVDGGMLM